MENKASENSQRPAWEEAYADHGVGYVDIGFLDEGQDGKDAEAEAHSRRVLEYDAVLKLIEKKTHWEPAAEYIRTWSPLSSPEELQHCQEEMREALRVYEAAAGVGASDLEDCREALKGAERGRALSAQDLGAVGRLAAASRQTGDYLRQHAAFYPRLADRALGMGVFNELERTLKKCIAPDGGVLDGASPILRELRTTVAVLQNRLQDHVNNVLRNGNYTKMLQENLVTVRSGRTVVPVKNEYRSQFPGLVIDQSSTGATVYMEPWVAVDLGNRVRSAVLAEKKEVEAILARLSGVVAQHAASLWRSLEELAWFDALMAVAAFSAGHNANLPEISCDGRFRLVEARHPLLEEHFSRSNLQARSQSGDSAPLRKVVPLSLDMLACSKPGEPEVRTVIITGPNTGGKTVSLKTVGLTVMMALAGLPVAASEGTIVPFLRNVWADIGDEQSLEQNLSTFSAHMAQVMKILPAASEDSLVLLDELGAGTDPAEGGALSMAILEYLHGRRTFCVVTTHLSELKVFANDTPGVCNAAMEFDEETLGPTYRVLMGVPGRSNALRIARRLGLPPELERSALEHLGQHRVEVDTLINDLEKGRLRNTRVGKKLHNERRDVRRLRQEFEDKLGQIEQERSNIVETTRSEVQKMADEARFRAHGLLRHAREQLEALERERRQSVFAAQAVAKELANVVIDSDNLEVFATLSPVSSQALATALRQVARCRYPEAVFEDNDAARVVAVPEVQSADGADREVVATGDADAPLLNKELSTEDGEEEQEAEVLAALSVSSTPGADILDARQLDTSDVRARSVMRVLEGELGSLAQQVSDRAQALEEALPELPRRAHIADRRSFAEFTQAAAQEPLEEKNSPAEPQGKSKPAAKGVSKSAEAPKVPSSEPLQVGSTVYVHLYGQEGKVLSLQGNKAEVQIGVVRIKLNVKDLEAIESHEQSQVVLPQSHAATVSPRIDLHGMTVDEALHELSYRLDEAFLANLSTVEIIHGKGTGALRKAVREYVKDHPMVDSFRYGEPCEGGIGITVVKLK